jgi:hypothetical protein
LRPDRRVNAPISLIESWPLPKIKARPIEFLKIFCLTQSIGLCHKKFSFFPETVVAADAIYGVLPIPSD